MCACVRACVGARFAYTTVIVLLKYVVQERYFYIVHQVLGDHS